jgi:hypothetical protein
MARTKVYTTFADLNTDGVNYTPSKALSVVPRRRSYLSASDAVYDYAVGHEFVVVDSTSPFDGCFVSTLDTNVLKEHGYTAVDISYNNNLNVEVSL